MQRKEGCLDILLSPPMLFVGRFVPHSLNNLLHLHVNAALSSKNSLIDRISNIKSTTKQPEYITAPGCKPSQLQ